MFVKSSTIFLKQDKLISIIKDISADLPRTEILQEKYELEKYVSHLNWKSKISAYGMACSLILYSVRPIISYRIFGDKIDFPFNLWFWFDAYQPGIFEIVYSLIFLVQFFMSFLLLACDLIFFSITVLVEFHVKMLAKDLHELKNEKSSKIAEQLNLKIRQHQNISKMINEVDDVFGIGCLASIALSIVIICLFEFQILVRNDFQNS